MAKWTPTNKSKAQLVGGITRQGDIVQTKRTTNQHPAETSQLAHNPDVRVRRLADWIANSEFGLGPDVAQFGGFLMGLAVAREFPEVVADLIKSILGDVPEHESVVQIANTIVTGDPDHKKGLPN
jgi:hypothetical protein